MKYKNRLWANNFVVGKTHVPEPQAGQFWRLENYQKVAKFKSRRFDPQNWHFCASFVSQTVVTLDLRYFLKKSRKENFWKLFRQMNVLRPLQTEKKFAEKTWCFDPL